MYILRATDPSPPCQETKIKLFTYPCPPVYDLRHFFNIYWSNIVLKIKIFCPLFISIPPSPHVIKHKHLD